MVVLDFNENYLGKGTWAWWFYQATDGGGSRASGTMRRADRKATSDASVSMTELICDAPNPGGPLTTRQPAETLVNAK